MFLNRIIGHIKLNSYFLESYSLQFLFPFALYLKNVTKYTNKTSKEDKLTQLFYFRWA